MQAVRQEQRCSNPAVLGPAGFRLPLAAHPVPQIRPLADTVHFKHCFTYLLTYLLT